MKRILFVTERYPPDLGGVATSAGRISHALVGLGVQVDVASWSRWLQPGEMTHEDGNPALYRIGRYRDWDATLPHTVNLVDWLFSTHRYDAVWGHYLAPSGFFAAWTGRMHGFPSIVSIRGNDIDREMFPPGDFARLRWTLENATRITAVTLELARKVTALCSRSDVDYLPNAVDPEVFQPIEPTPGLREKLGILGEEAVLGFAGELRDKKGQQPLLDALAKVREKRPACLLVIGEVRPSQMAQLMLHPRTLVTGQLQSPQEVNEHMQLCDVYLQPSLWDGMPNALLEAMAAGCGCIASDAGGIPEIIRPGIDGVLLPRWQLHRLDEAILEWLDAEPAHRSQVRKAARARILEAFTPSQEHERLKSLLASL